MGFPNQHVPQPCGTPHWVAMATCRSVAQDASPPGGGAGGLQLSPIGAPAELVLLPSPEAKYWLVG